MREYGSWEGRGWEVESLVIWGRGKWRLWPWAVDLLDHQGGRPLVHRATKEEETIKDTMVRSQYRSPTSRARYKRGIK